MGKDQIHLIFSHKDNKNIGDYFMSFWVFTQGIVNGLLIGAIYALSALGVSLIWGTMEMVNFAHGDILMLGMYASYWMFILFKIDPLVSLPVVFVIFFLLGLFYYRAVISTVFKSPAKSFAQILATKATGITIMALVIYFCGSNYRTIEGNILSGSYNLGGLYIGIPEFYSSLISIVSIIIVQLFMNRTKVGRAIRATAINKEAASLVGIDVEYIYKITVGLGIAFAGMAGLLLSNFYYIHPEAASIFGTLAFVTVVLGGMGSISGTLYGGLLLGIVTTFGGIFASTYKYVFAYLLYLIVVYFKPKGLKGW